eukprot:5606313-Pleurochrysis_carterae.AAC.5
MSGVHAKRKRKDKDAAAEHMRVELDAAGEASQQLSPEQHAAQEKAHGMIYVGCTDRLWQPAPNLAFGCTSQIARS